MPQGRKRTARADLSTLEKLRAEFGPGIAGQKRALLQVLGRTRFDSASLVGRYHEALVFLRAYPDDRGLLREVETQLERFELRPDFRKFRSALADSGIAGTSTTFSFFAETAWRLAERYPGKLEIVPEENASASSRDPVERWLPFVAHSAEVPGIDEIAWSSAEWLDRMRGPEQTGAALLLRRLRTALPTSFLFERVVDDLDLTFRLAAGVETPSRTRERLAGAPVVCHPRPLRRGRPDLRAEIAREPLAVERLTGRRAAQVLELARNAMVTRSRDLDAFAYGSVEDVRLVTWEEGLQFAVFGVLPERRLLLEAVYGFLTLKNGVPIGYLLNSALFGSAEIAFNVFENFRGIEAAHVYARGLATVRQVFRADAFTIFPYQLGDDNDEALDSGAWWFYRKLGFVPREPHVVALMRREMAEMKRDPSHRSSREILVRLSRENLFFHLGRERRDVIGEVPLPSVGLAVTALLSRRFGATPDRGAAACDEEARDRLGARRLAGWSADELLMFGRWAPVVLLLPGVETWSLAERAALLAVIRAKGGREEAEFVHRFDAHPRLPRALARLARRSDRV
ncbi:MAG: hypothetical protein ABI639_00860 [Thermoanaerobaculia bacterium]